MGRLGRVLASFVGISEVQAAERGSFHLPVAANLGKLCLEPGDYHVVVERNVADGHSSVMIQGSETSLYATAVAVYPQGTPGVSSLELMELNGEVFVSKYRSGRGGRTFVFATPEVKPLEAALVQTQLVEVAA